VVLSVDGRTRRTEYIKNDLSPTWNTVLEFDFAVKEDIGKHSLLVQCFDHDMIGSGTVQLFFAQLCCMKFTIDVTPDDFIGGHTVPLKDYVDGAVHNQWFTLQDKKHGNRGEVRLEISVVKV